jgi:hypothetical protein
VVASILPEDFDSEDTCDLSKEEKESVLHNYSIINLMYNNVSKVIQELIFNHEDMCDDAHFIWVALKGMYSNANDENEEEEDESLKECSTSTSCVSPLETSSRDKKNNNNMTTASNQANLVAPVSELGGTGFGSDQHHTTSLIIQSTPHQPKEVISASSQSPSRTNDSLCHIANINKKKENEKKKFDFDLDKMTKKDKKNVLELIKRVRR